MNYHGTVRMTPTLATLGARADDVAVHERNGGFGSNERLKPDCPSVVDPHHHLVLVNGISVGRVQEDAAVSHHGACAVALPRAEDRVLPKFRRPEFVRALVDGPLHVLHEVLHDLRLKAPLLDPVLQEHSHLRPEGSPHVGVVEDFQLPTRNLLPHHGHEHHVPVSAL